MPEPLTLEPQLISGSSNTARSSLHFCCQYRGRGEIIPIRMCPRYRVYQSRLTLHLAPNAHNILLDNTSGPVLKVLRTWSYTYRQLHVRPTPAPLPHRPFNWHGLWRRRTINKVYQRLCYRIRKVYTPNCLIAHFGLALSMLHCPESVQDDLIVLLLAFLFCLCALQNG